MKKILLLATMLVATMCNAQVILWNGDDKEVGSDGGFWNRAEPTVIEEGDNKTLAGKMGVRGIPNMVLFKGGKEIDRAVGYMDKVQLVEFLSKHI